MRQHPWVSLIGDVSAMGLAQFLAIAYCLAFSFDGIAGMEWIFIATAIPGYLLIRLTNRFFSHRTAKAIYSSILCTLFCAPTLLFIPDPGLPVNQPLPIPTLYLVLLGAVNAFGKDMTPVSGPFLGIQALGPALIFCGAVMFSLWRGNDLASKTPFE